MKIRTRKLPAIWPSNAALPKIWRVQIAPTPEAREMAAMEYADYCMENGHV